MNIIITGGTKGIGRAIAQILVLEGHHMAICARSQSDLIDTQRSLHKLNDQVEVMIFKADLSVQASVEQFADHVLKSWSQIDVLINNAGAYLPGLILEEPAGQLDKMLRVNLLSAYHLTRAIAPQMVKRHKGLIVNMCSVASLMALPNGGSYSIAKFALFGFNKVLREELKDKGVKVTAILPGATWSASWSGVDLPKARLMEAEDIAKTVKMIISLSDSAVVEDIVLRPQLGDL